MPSHRRPRPTRAHPLRTAPWRRAPLLLLRRPVVFVGIVVATAVLALAAAAGVLFTSTLGTASLRAQAAEACPEASMPTLTATLYPQPGAQVPIADVQAAGTAALRRSGIPGGGYAVSIARGRINNLDVKFFWRAGALDHVQRLTPAADGTGAWFPDDYASRLGLHPGDSVTMDGGSRVRVAGIYRALASDPFKVTTLPRYWCTWSSLIRQSINGNYGTPPFLIADPLTVADAGTPTDGYQDRSIAVSWYAPIPLDSMTLAGVRAASARTKSASHDLADLIPTGTPVDFGPSGAALYNAAHPAPSAPLDKEITRAQQIQDGLAGSVLPISIAGALVALLLVAEAGGSWAARRAREVRLLTARGVGPAAIAAKAALETVPAAVVGLGIGYGLAYLLMRSLGPASTFAPGAPLRAASLAGAAVAAGLLLISIIGGLTARERPGASEPDRLRAVVRHMPYELLLIGGGVWAWLAIRSGSGLDFTDAIIDVHPLLLIFPLLGLTGVVLLLGRLAALLIPVLAPAARRLPVAGYLALRRIAGSRAIAVGLLLGTALPCGLLAYSGTVSTGVHDELLAKYHTNVGAPRVLELIGVRAATPDLDDAGTAVVLYQNGPTLAGGRPVTVLGVDPATFATYSYLTGDQRQDLGKITDTDVILVHAPDGLDPREVHLGSTTLSVRVVARSDVFPGYRNSYQPMIVVDRDALAHVDAGLDRTNEAWTSDADLAAVSTAIQRDGYTILTQFDPAIRVTSSGLLPITWIFGYLRALAVLIGAVAVAGLVFALSARTRRRTVSYVMSRRMGLRQGTHLRSLLLELLIVVGLGWLAGTLAGLGGYAVLTGSLDLQPTNPPGAQFVLPSLSLAVTAAVVAVVIALAAAGTHAAAERANPADILRLE